LLRESQLPVSGRPQVLPEGDREDQGRAGDLLDLLGIHSASPEHFVRFAHESGPIFARSYIVDEREFDADASPKWMMNP